MCDESGLRNPVEVLADEFLARQRLGEQPSLAEFAERYPDLADEIHELFPLLLEMEDVRQAVAEAPLSIREPLGTFHGAWATTASSARSAAAAWASSTRPSRSRSVAGLRSRSCPRGALDAHASPPLPSRGPLGGQAAPHQHRPGLRRRPGTRRVLLRHAVHSRPAARRGLS